jgi:hypothetical protein
MITDQIGNFVGQLILSLLLSTAWLCLCRLLRIMRLRIGATLVHGIAALASLAACLLPIAAPGPARFAAGILVAGLLFLGWRRSLRNDSLKADTIVTYFSDTIIGRQ